MISDSPNSFSSQLEANPTPNTTPLRCSPSCTSHPTNAGRVHQRAILNIVVCNHLRICKAEKTVTTTASEWVRKKFWSGEYLQGRDGSDKTEDADIITAMGWISTQWQVGLDPMVVRTAPAISVEVSLTMTQ